MGGPLGKYSQTVAALTATTIILAQLLVWVMLAAGWLAAAVPQLEQAFYIAIGAVFGAAASTAVNGHTIEAAHRRLDTIAAPPAGILEATGLQPVSSTTTTVSETPPGQPEQWEVKD